MQLIDSHCHLDFPVFDNDRETILADCQQRGINNIIVPAVTANSWNRLLSVCESSTILHPTLGMHPMFMDEHQPKHLAELQKRIEQSNPIAVGEIGLDFFIEDHDKASQLELFEQQLIIAKQFDLPVILHIRKAYDHALQLLKKHHITKGIAHAFSGSEQQASHFIKQGLLLGIGGVITYPKATKIRRLFQQLPLEHIALETDAPDMLPANSTSTRNTPVTVELVLKELAELRQLDEAELASKTSANIISMFAI